MNKDNAMDYLPLVRALAEGKMIQHIVGDDWHDLPAPAFDTPADHYRIKPEPPLECWVQWDEGEPGCAYSTLEEAQKWDENYSFEHSRIVHMIEAPGRSQESPTN